MSVLRKGNRCRRGSRHLWLSKQLELKALRAQLRQAPALLSSLATIFLSLVFSCMLFLLVLYAMASFVAYSSAFFRPILPKPSEASSTNSFVPPEEYPAVDFINASPPQRPTFEHYVLQEIRKLREEQEQLQNEIFELKHKISQYEAVMKDHQHDTEVQERSKQAFPMDIFCQFSDQNFEQLEFCRHGIKELQQSMEKSQMLHEQLLRVQQQDQLSMKEDSTAALGFMRRGSWSFGKRRLLEVPDDYFLTAEDTREGTPESLKRQKKENSFVVASPGHILSDSISVMFSPRREQKPDTPHQPLERIQYSQASSCNQEVQDNGNDAKAELHSTKNNATELGDASEIQQEIHSVREKRIRSLQNLFSQSHELYCSSVMLALTFCSISPAHLPAKFI